MNREPVHYVPVSVKRFASIIRILEQHPYRNQWGRDERQRLASAIEALAQSFDFDPGTEAIPMAVDRLREVAGWLPGAVGFSPPELVALLESYRETY